MSALDREFRNTNPEAYPTYFNIEYNTDECGFERVALCEEPGLSYEFNSYIVLKDKETGLFYGAASSGCSCPTPFEEFTSLSTLTKLRDLAHLEEELDSTYSSVLGCEYDTSRRGPMRDEIANCAAQARRAGLK